MFNYIVFFVNWKLQINTLYTIPQLVSFFFINIVVFAFAILVILVFIFSKYVLPRFIRLFARKALVIKFSIFYNLLILRLKIFLLILLISYPINILFNILYIYYLYVLVIAINSVLNMLLNSISKDRPFQVLYETIILVSLPILLYYFYPLFYLLPVFGAFLDLYVINIPAAIFDLSKHSFCLTPEGSIVLLSTFQENNTNPTSGDSASPTTDVEGLPSDLRTADIYDLKQARTRLNSRSNYHYKKLISILDTNSAYNNEFNRSVKTLLAYQQDKVKIVMELD